MLDAKVLLHCGGLVRQRLRAMEVQLAHDAEAGCLVAMALSPRALRDYVVGKRSEGEWIKLPTAVMMYIDDLSGVSLGIYRAMAGLVITWGEMEVVNIQYGTSDEYSSKGQLGEATELLGIDSLWSAGLAKVSEKKRDTSGQGRKNRRGRPSSGSRTFGLVCFCRR